MKPGGPGGNLSVEDALILQRKDVPRAVLFGAHLPSVFFILLLALFTFARHHSPTAPWLVAVIGGSFLVIGAWPASLGSKARSKWDWIPLFSVIFAVGLGVKLGIWNSATMEPYVHGQFLTRYSDVLPNADPIQYSDAGIVHFAAGSVLDTGSSAGFEAWPHTYCAAPIVSSDDANGTGTVKVGFWAVGIDCCGTRESFACDDAAVMATRSGFRVETHILGKVTGHSVSENFAKAVNMAAAAYNLQVAKEPVLISWQRDPEFVAMAAYQMSLMIFIGLGMGAIVCCLGCQTAISSASKTR